MTAHNHGYDPTCKETRLPDGKMIGECMTDTAPTPTPETDAAEAMVEQTDYSNTGRGQERQRKEAAWEYARSLETRLAAAEAKAPKWEAIESAPKDGSYFLVSRDNWGGSQNVYVAYYAGAWCRNEWDCGFESEHFKIDIKIWKYWMPLPTPPMKEGE